MTILKRMTFSVAPGLLIAMPSLQDPNFDHSVLLLCDHSAEGAFGIVINRPSKVPVETVCEEFGIPWSGQSETPIYSGGPVDVGRGWILHSSELRAEGDLEVMDGLTLSSSRVVLDEYARDPEGPFRLFMGYAGWGPSQLDQEIAEGSWLTAPVNADFVFKTAAPEYWREALAVVGVDPAHLVDGSGELN